MNKQTIEREVVRLLRESALGGSGREVSVGAPLGEQGIGLDSLALLQFITAVENAFEVEIPEEFWLESGRLRLQDIVSLISDDNGKLRLKPLKLPQAVTAEDNLTTGEKVARIIREHGWLRGAGHLAHRILRKVLGWIYGRETLYILAFDLTQQQIPRFPASRETYFREGSLWDVSAVDGLWVSQRQNRKQKLFLRRLSKGYNCYTAWEQGKIVAIDWVADAEDHEPKTGLRIRLRPGSCYGLDLDEHPQYRERGLGLTMLTYSLERCRQSGYQVQYTIVHAKNRKMLRTAIQLVGYRKVGEVKTTRWLRWRRSVWQIGDRIGRSGVLEL